MKTKYGTILDLISEIRSEFNLLRTVIPTGDWEQSKVKRITGYFDQIDNLRRDTRHWFKNEE